MYYNWSERPNIVLYEHRLNDVRGRQGNNFVPELLKQSRPGHHLDPMVLLSYPDQDICVVSHV